MDPSSPPPAAAALLAWYDRHRRQLPWRASRDPYRVWLAEVMLQQTTVAAAGPRFNRFLARFPDLAALAAADAAAVTEEWAGLGYYARARNLHACARAVAAAGGFPREVEALRRLPGIGAYTAAAVAAIAFDRAVVPVDGNVERVAARIGAVTAPLPGARRVLATIAAGWMADAHARARPGDFAQALFDLGATVCTARAPVCALCPWRDSCAGFAAGIAAGLPRKAAKPARPVRRGAHFLLTDPGGRVLVRRRPPSGVLGGMLELPGTPWREGAAWGEAAFHWAPVEGVAWRAVPGVARHGFTHFLLEMELWAAVGAMPAPEGMEFRAGVGAVLPTAMRRLLELAAGAQSELSA